MHLDPSTEIKVLISEKLPGIIWKMNIDSPMELLVIEVRNKEDHEVSFTSIDLKKGIVNFNNVKTEERWHTGIEGVYAGILLLHGYEAALSPAHKGIIAIDGFTGRVLWANYHLGVQQLSEKQIVAFDTRIQPRRLFSVDYRSGAVVKNQTSSSFNEINNSDLVTPETISELPQGLQEHLPGPVKGEIFCKDINNFRIVSLHTISQELLTQHLFILEDERLIFHDLLNHDIQKLQPEAFVIHRSRLIYIKNHSEIKVLSL